MVTTDASEVAISATLTQPDNYRHHRPVAYERRKLTAAEQACPPHVLELLAVACACSATTFWVAAPPARWGGGPIEAEFKKCDPNCSVF